jgi:hypothetical protein
MAFLANRLCLILQVYVFGVAFAAAAEPRSTTTIKELSFGKILEWVQKTPTGSRLIQEFKDQKKVVSSEELAQWVLKGRVSKTDAVLIRHYQASTGEETREKLVTVYYNPDQPLEEVIFDLVHELYHATAQPLWDPYDPELTVESYIKNSIEGKGGEALAVQAECQAYLELKSKYKLKSRRCDRYILNQKVAYQTILEDFYRVGGALGELKKNKVDLSQFPFLKSEKVKLYSATGNSPYPVSLLREYKALTEVACENTLKRSKSQKSRSVASVDLKFLRQNERLLEKRCQAPQGEIAIDQAAQTLLKSSSAPLLQ